MTRIGDVRLRLLRWLAMAAILGLLFTPVECTLAVCPTPGAAAPGPTAPLLAAPVEPRLAAPAHAGLTIGDDGSRSPRLIPLAASTQPALPAQVDGHPDPDAAPATTPPRVLGESPGSSVPVRPAVLDPAGEALSGLPLAPVPGTAPLLPPTRHLTGPTPPPP